MLSGVKGEVSVNCHPVSRRPRTHVNLGEQRLVASCDERHPRQAAVGRIRGAAGRRPPSTGRPLHVHSHRSSTIGSRSLSYDPPFARSIGVRGEEGRLLADETRADAFTEFVTTHETRLRQSLTAAFGADRGREAAAEALAYGWEHWDRLSTMENPVGYLYRVGYDRARRIRGRKVRLPAIDPQRQVWIEPGLPAALASLPIKQRTVVALLYGYQWSMSEVAAQLGVSKGTVQTHAQRGLDRLRKKLGVEL